MSYDEQRISDQIDGGLHQQNQQEMTQTMTKEQIVKRELNGEEIEFFGDNMGNLFDCMEIYKDQQLSAERERGQQFPTTEQMDAAINVSIGKMFGGLEAESIKYFLQTSKINGSFRRRLHDCIKSASMLVDIKAKTELLKERERAGKLVEAIELVTSLGYVSDILTKPLNEYKQTLNEYDPKK